MKHGSTILIVDDEASPRDILDALLSPEGYHLEFACNGSEALEKAEQLTPSLVLLDVMMPEMDGFEVCRQLRSMPRLAEVPIIMITALDDRDSLLRGIEAGADDFISKPFDRTELRARVKTIIQLDRYRRLLAERMKFEWVIQYAHDGYLIINDEDQILYTNSQARLFLGLPSDASGQKIEVDQEPISETFLTVVRKQYRLEPQEAWITWPVSESSNAAIPRYLVRPESPTAKAFWLQVDSLDLPSELETSKILRLCDVTAQITSQRNRHGFHTMISHKLRTPLSGILGSLEFIAEHAARLSGKEVSEFSEIAVKSVRRLHSEIEDILQYLNVPSVYKSGESFTLSQLQALATQVTTSLELPAVTVSLQNNLNAVHLRLSRQAFGLMLWEILENSKKFHPAHAPTVEIVASHEFSGLMSLKISDNGISLSPEQLSQIWAPYYQGEKHLTGEMQGMGLGLSTVASLVWEAGGTCRAYNREDGPGLVVELLIPILR